MTSRCLRTNLRYIVLTVLLTLAPPSARAGEQDVFVKTPTGVLWGTFVTPAATPKAVAVILPGSGPTNRDGNGPTIHTDTYKLLAEGLAAKNIASLRIDKRGIGESSSALASESAITFDTNIADSKAWVADIKGRTGAHCVWLIGHSEGSLVAELTAKDNSDICGLVLMAPMGEKFGDILRSQIGAQTNLPEEVKTQSLQVLGELEAGRAVPTVPSYLYPLFRPSVQPYLISLLPLDPAAILAQIKLPVLILQGEHDIQLSLDGAKRLAAAKPDAKLVVLPGANHIFKEASADRAQNIATYGDPTLPLAPGVIDTVAGFAVGQ